MENYVSRGGVQSNTSLMSLISKCEVERALGLRRIAEKAGGQPRVDAARVELEPSETRRTYGTEQAVVDEVVDGEDRRKPRRWSGGLATLKREPFVIHGESPSRCDGTWIPRKTETQPNPIGEDGRSAIL